LAREKLKDFLNQKGSNSDMISYVRTEAPDGIGVDPGTGEELLDLNNDLKGLLGDYVRFIMEDANNDFLPNPGNELASPSKKGDDLVLADLQGFEKVHVPQGTELKSKLNENSNSGKFDDLSTLIDKVGKNFSNQEKLKEIQGRPLSKQGETLVSPSGENNDIVKATQQMFLKNNRFANVDDEKSKAFAEKPVDPKQFEMEKDSNEGSVVIQNKFGQYDKDLNKTNLDGIKKIGASILLKSSGFSAGSTPGESDNVDDVIASINDLTSNNLDVNSGFTKIDFNIIRPKNAKGFPEDISGNSVRDNRGEWINADPDSINSKTFGSTYNSEFRFTGNTIKLHKIQAAISMIAVKNVGKIFYEGLISTLREADKIDLIKSGEEYQTANPEGDLLSHIMGKSRSLQSSKLQFNVFSNLLANTTHNYGSAVNQGIKEIFGEPFESNSLDSIANSKNISQSPGFWIAVARSVLKSFDNIQSNITGLDSLNSNELFLVYKDIIESNKFIQFFNAMAIIGDVSLLSNNSVTSEAGNVRDVDLIPDTNSIPGKSRKKNGRYKNELSWNQDSSPSMYLLPVNIIRAASRLSNTVRGESPVRAMFGSKLVENTYTGIDVDGSYNRIPNEVVKIVEDKLEAEYVPFYIQDLRTNEIVSFKAFLDRLTDTITPNYTGVSSYGRMDDVQIYQSTSRSLSVGFTMYATNKEDFDSMWYKINKFVTLLYPQWTPGTMVSNADNSKFYQPFSQVVGASPIVRIRIGDIVKSNYSRFGLSRVFGIGDNNVSPMSDDYLYGGTSKFAAISKKVYDIYTEVILKLWLLGAGSPQSAISVAFGSAGESANSQVKIAKNFAKKISMQGLASQEDLFGQGSIINGFANPLAVNELMNQLVDPNTDPSNPKLGFKGDTDSLGALRQVYLKPNVNLGYLCTNGKKYLINRKIKVRVVEKGRLSDISNKFSSDKIGYRVLCVDPASPSGLLDSGESLIVKHEDIYPDPKLLFNASYTGLGLVASDPLVGAADTAVAQGKIIENALNLGIPADTIDWARTFTLRQEGFFMLPEINPYVRAFDTTKGRGLAGVIKSVQFDWLSDFPWETDFNSRAPIGCKISFQFDVIHDLPPGMDHSGYNKAPLYNVGGIMRNISGDVYSDDGRSAEFNFRNAGKNTSRVKGENNR
tara:strand:+ start:2807 stop:6283 length:3477 start_codon:yes stop_codon:yes gene_type:complete